MHQVLEEKCTTGTWPRASKHPHRLLTSAVYTGPDNYTNAQGVSWTFNNLATNQSEAQAMCNKQCGHLASYTSAQEQNDVEQFYISNVRGRAVLHR